MTVCTPRQREATARARPRLSSTHAVSTTAGGRARWTAASASRQAASPQAASRRAQGAWTPRLPQERRSSGRRQVWPCLKPQPHPLPRLRLLPQKPRPHLSQTLPPLPAPPPGVPLVFHKGTVRSTIFPVCSDYAMTPLGVFCSLEHSGTPPPLTPLLNRPGTVQTLGGTGGLAAHRKSWISAPTRGSARNAPQRDPSQCQPAFSMEKHSAVTPQTTTSPQSSGARLEAHPPKRLKSLCQSSPLGHLDQTSRTTLGL